MADFISIIVFVLAYLVGRFIAPDSAIYLATSAMMMVSIGHLIYLWRKDKKIEQKALLTNGAILILGSITLLLQNPLFIKLKPTIVNYLIGLLFLFAPIFFKKNLTEKMLGSALQMPNELWQKLNYAWVLFFFMVGTLNAVVALLFSETFWLGFKFWGLMGSSLIFIAGQFFFLRQYIQEQKND